MIGKVILALSMAGTLNIASASFFQQESICGQDDRVPSSEPRVARLQMPTAAAGCTVTMIGRVCAITAGHCTTTFGEAHFNTPPSVDGHIVHPASEDKYQVDVQSAKFVNGGAGNDWAVLRLRANSLTGKYPGDAQGMYEVSFDAPQVGDMIQITGYGSDRMDPTRHFAQQVHQGPVYSIIGSIMRHRADTMGGNSGSSVINVSTGKIIGIHTHGGCYGSSGSNQSTLIGRNAQAQEAIRDCLAWEQTHL